MRKTTTILMLVALMCFGLAGAYAQPLFQADRLAWDAATDMVVIEYTDLTETSDNTAQVIDDAFTVAAKQSCELVAAVLKTPFIGATNAYNSVEVTVGDGTDADMYLESMQLNSYGTEVYLKLGRSNWQTAATNSPLLSVTTQTGTYIPSLTLQSVDLNGTNVVTNVIYTATAVVTNVSTTAGAGISSLTQSAGAKVYTASDTIDITFTPMAGYSLADLTQGELWLFFRRLDARVN